MAEMGDRSGAGGVSEHLDGNTLCKADMILRRIELTSHISFVLYINLRRLLATLPAEYRLIFK